MSAQSRPGRHPALAQSMAALERANQIRMARVALKRQVYNREVTVRELLLKPPAALDRTGTAVVTIAQVLAWQYGWATARAENWLRKQGVSITLAVCDASPPTRAKLARALGRIP